MAVSAFFARLQSRAAVGYEHTGALVKEAGANRGSLLAGQHQVWIPFPGAVGRDKAEQFHRPDKRQVRREVSPGRSIIRHYGTLRDET